MASLSKCDNLFSRPRNHSSRPPRRSVSTFAPACLFAHSRARVCERRRLSPFRVHVLVTPRRRVIVRLTALTLWHHYDVNERGVSILAGVRAQPAHYFPSSIACPLNIFAALFSTLNFVQVVVFLSLFLSIFFQEYMYIYLFFLATYVKFFLLPSDSRFIYFERKIVFL